jgi:hypothetical protein
VKVTGELTLAASTGSSSDGLFAEHDGGVEATLVVAEAALLVAFGSGVADAICTVLVMMPLCCGALTMMVMVLLMPAAALPVHWIVAFVRVQFHGPVFMETKVVPAGSVSVMTMPLAASGPKLRTPIVYVIAAPLCAVGGADFVTARSAPLPCAVSMKTKWFAFVLQPPRETTTSSSVRPEAPAVKTIESVPLPDVMVPLSIYHAYVAPGCTGTLAMRPD